MSIVIDIHLMVTIRLLVDSLIQLVNFSNSIVIDKHISLNLLVSIVIDYKYR